MPEPKQATLAVISDLHCHLAKEPHDSFLTVGKLRKPSGRHPVEAVLDLIDSEGLQADALLVLGDLTNRASVEGLQQGWDYSLEIGRKLGTSTVVPIIGNHDIDSHRLNPSVGVFNAVQNLRRGFPFRDQADNQSFFSDGYCVLKIGDAEIVAINTVIDQTDAASAKRGAFDVARIARMESSLSHTLVSPLRGALMHHHPILHSGLFLQDVDVIPTGDVLLSALRGLGCRFVIHGHKHFTRLSYVDGVAVFASGSFSALMQEFGTSVANTFHMVHVQSDEPNEVRGIVHTWVFRFGSGWRRSNAEYAGFPYSSGFGRRAPLPNIIRGFEQLAETDATKSRFLEWEVLNAVPDAKYLTPSERDQVNAALLARDLKMSDYDQGQLELWRSYRP